MNHKKAFWIVTALVILAGLSILVWYRLSYRERLSLTDPTQSERYYAMVGTDFSVAKYCEEVSPHAVDGQAPWSPAGHQISLVRSACFRAVAINLKDSSYCAQVAPVSTGGIFPLDGSAFSPEYCAREARSNNGEHIGSGYDMYGAKLMDFLHALGYTDADMTPPNSAEPDPEAFYSGLKFSVDQSARADFLKRFDAFMRSQR